MESFLLVFIPLFIAIDPIGNIPLFLGLTDGFPQHEKKKLASQSVITALIIGIVFCVGGNYVLTFMGITSADFQIGGGILLLILSIREIFNHAALKKNRHLKSDERMLGVVPLGIPLIAGPAMMTTLLILHDLYSFKIIVLALVTNLIFVHLTLTYADLIVHKFGVMTTKAFAKVVAIFLAGIAVMMIRRGLVTIFSGL